MNSFPLLQGADRGVYPHDKVCPVCGEAFLRGLAYLTAGALLLSEDGQDSLHTDRLKAFLNIGFHGTDAGVRDSADVGVVIDLSGGQFDLQWCSVACMRHHLLELLVELENRLAAGDT